MQIEKLLSVHTWLQFGNEERLLMRELFGIPRSSGSIMLDGKLTSDGHTQGDLRVVTVEKMQRFLNSNETDFDTLLALTMEEVYSTVKAKSDARFAAQLDAIYQEKLENAKKLIVSLMSSIKQLPIEAQIELKKEVDLLLANQTTPNETDKEVKKGNNKRTAKSV